VRENGESACFRIQGVAAEFGRDETLDTGSDGGVEEGALVGEVAVVEGGNDGVLAFQRINDGARAGVVYGADGDSGGEGGRGSAIGARKGGNVEFVGGEEGFDEGGAEVARCLEGC